MVSGPDGAPEAPTEPAAEPVSETPAGGGPIAGVGTLCAIIAALTFVVFASVADHEYVDFDDFALILWNPDVRVESVSDALAIAFSRPQMSGYVPLTTLSHQLDFLLHGNDPTGPLLENVILHVATSLLIFLALIRLTGARGASAMVAAIFAIHPLHVESVAWASSRKDVLSGVFFGAMLLSYAHFTEKPASTPRYLLVLLWLALGLLAKPMLVTAPFVLLLLDYWPLRRLDREAVREKLPMFGLVAIVAFYTLRVQSQTGAFSFGRGVSFPRRIANAIDSYFSYTVDAFWPTDLAAFYPYPAGELSVAVIAAQAAVLAGLTAIAIALRRSRPYGVVGWLWFVGMLVPVIGLVQVGMQARADRYMYLPLLGLSLVVAFGVADAARDRTQQRIAGAAGAVAVLALAVVSTGQVATWRNSLSVYEHALDVSPDAAFPEFRLGMVYAMIGQFDKAEPHLDRAYALNPSIGRDAVRQLDSMAAAHAAMERFGEAVKTSVLAIQIARRTEQEDRVPELQERLSDYRSGRRPEPATR